MLPLCAAAAAAAATGGCAPLLNATCGAARAGGAQACDSCLIDNQRALVLANCTPAEEKAFCVVPPTPAPTASCGFTDSNGDRYDLSGVARVDGAWHSDYACFGPPQGGDQYYHIGLCGGPTMSKGFPKLGCEPWPGMDTPGAAVCSFDPCDSPDLPNQYNLGMASTQRFADGPIVGESVTVEYAGGSGRGGCDQGPNPSRRTTVNIQCDPCHLSNISRVDEPERCHYVVTISSIHGCATNRPLPTAKCPHLCDHATGACSPAAKGTPGAQPTLAACAAACSVPTPAPTPVPTPTPPLATYPCIRFGHTIPVAHRVDVEVSQTSPGNHTYTWTDVGFGEFSGWVAEFEAGTGSATVWESVGGRRGAQLLHVTDVPLTPGPLVIVLKCPEATQSSQHCWPPGDAMLGGSIEAVAASYTPEPRGAKLRLFNLAEGVSAASLARAGASLASGVKFGLGSEWGDVPLQAGEYTASGGGAAVASRSVALRDQEVLTLWLLGSAGSADAALAPRLLPLDDAPHNGLFCTSNLTR